ncbi:unnamed protein product [Vitrella brassicaformis CCMP3155]|uniref:Poly [ADP-ribose] polymerase n=2 Tax=Vitrella brassicaformis TaxID=1169539 RepID=A0A0G4FMF2_VITBC|nr:unnamed protein product [Vitrella brassicaformis CCMP3155]|eukprot:CEM15096.1 unnamed protein product [Vitrella brassicaformis CCMP3155]
MKARVSCKEELKGFTGKNGKPGKRFTCLLTDESGEIRACFFYEAADRYHGMLQNGQVYSFSHFSVKEANRQFNRTGDYEAMFHSSSSVEPAQDDGTIPLQATHPHQKIVQIKQLPTKSNVNLLGIITKADNISHRGGSSHRTLRVVDDSEAAIEVTLWGDKITQSQRVDFNDGDIHTIDIKGGSTGEYRNQKNVQVGGMAWMAIDSDRPEAAALKTWYIQTGGNVKRRRTRQGPRPSSPPSLFPPSCGRYTITDVTCEMQEKVATLFDKTSHASGCPHSTNLRASNVVKVLRVTDPTRIFQYNAKRREIQEKLARRRECGNTGQAYVVPFDATIRPHALLKNLNGHSSSSSRSADEGMGESEQLSETVDSSINECWLFHGTNAAHMTDILRDGIDFRVGREGGMFGPGMYFASEACKSHCYASGGRPYCVILLCRVLLGDMYFAKHADPSLRRPPVREAPAGSPMERDLYDSVVGKKDSTSCDSSGMFRYNTMKLNHNEMIVYDRSQAYIEYIISYENN